MYKAVSLHIFQRRKILYSLKRAEDRKSKTICSPLCIISICLSPTEHAESAASELLAFYGLKFAETVLNSGRMQDLQKQCSVFKH